MKKFSLLMMLFGIATISFLSSCDSEDDDDTTGGNPVLNITPEGSLDAVEGSTVTVEVFASQNTSTKRNLKSLEIDADGVVNDTLIEYPANTPSDNFTVEFTAPIVGQQNNISFILKDRDDKMTTKSLQINGTSAVTTTPLGNATSFSLVRCGSNNDPDEFGIKFDEVNGSAPNFTALIVTVSGADKLVELSNSDWTDIDTQEALAQTVDDASGSTQFTLDLGSAGQSLDKTIATKVGSTYRLIHFSNSSQATCSGGTEWTIEGEVKQ